jgi:HEAT repeat protein
MTDPPILDDLKRLADSELVRRVLDAEDIDSDQRWRAIAELHGRGSRATFDLAAELCRSTDPRRVCDGLDMLSQFGTPERVCQEDARRIIRDCLTPDRPVGVLVSAASAAGHQADDVAVPLLVRLAGHPSAEVRHSVACALGGRPGAEVVPTLMGLMTDVDADVREWSTFGLARLRQDDSPEIRSAFWARIEDPDLDTRWEAIAGLAVRNVFEVRACLETELRRAAEVENDCFPLLEAAHAFLDPTLNPLLAPLDHDLAWVLDPDDA